MEEREEKKGNRYGGPKIKEDEDGEWRRISSNLYARLMTPPHYCDVKTFRAQQRRIAFTPRAVDSSLQRSLNSVP